MPEGVLIALVMLVCIGALLLVEKWFRNIQRNK
jgi:hypothetical protein